jgi:hypothetical protein
MSERTVVPFLVPLPALLAIAAALPAQTGSWSPDTAAPGLGGRVSAFTHWQSELYAGGSWFAAKGGVIRSVARWDGAAWRPVGTGLELLVGWGPFADATVRAMCEYQGELVVAGTFDRAGGVAANNIARWNGSTWQPLAQGLEEIAWDADVRALAVYQNELWATGTFHVAGGQPCNGLAKWNGTAWTPVGAGLVSSATGNPAGHALRVVGSDLVLAGEFTAVNGVACNRIARWNGTAWSPYGPGFDGAVSSVEVHGGQLVAAGSYSFSGASVVQGPARWNGSAWQQLAPGGPQLVAALQSLGTVLYAGGSFSSPGGCIARFDGTAWSGFGSVAGIFSGTTGTAVAALGEHNGELLVGGEFTRAGAPPGSGNGVASANVVAYDGSAFRTFGSGDGADGTVRGMVQLGADRIVFGAFAQIGGVTARGLARWDGDRFWRFADCDGSIESAAVWNGDLVVSGTFTQLGGQPVSGVARRLANGTWTQLGPPLLLELAVHQGQLHAAASNELRRWNGTGWTTLAVVTGIGTRLLSHANGGLYLTTTNWQQHRVYRWDGSAPTQIGSMNDAPTCLAAYGGDLVVGGRFTTINGLAVPRLARWNGTVWSALGGGVAGSSVDAITVLDGDLYAGANGDPRGFLLRWNGSAWAAVPGALDGLPVSLFADAAVGSVHASGAFLRAAGLPLWNRAEWRTQPQWRNRLHGLAASPGAAVPLLRGTGTLQAGTPWTYTVAATPLHVGVLALGLSRVDLPLFGGTLVPSPDALLVVVGDATGASGTASPFPASVPEGLAVFAQCWLLDATAPAGFTATNALECLAP